MGYVSYLSIRSTKSPNIQHSTFNIQLQYRVQHKGIAVTECIYDTPFSMAQTSHNSHHLIFRSSRNQSSSHPLDINPQILLGQEYTKSGFLLPAAVHVDVENFSKHTFFQYHSIIQPPNGLDLVFRSEERKAEDESGGRQRISMERDS